MSAVLLASLASASLSVMAAITALVAQRVRHEVDALSQATVRAEALGHAGDSLRSTLAHGRARRGVVRDSVSRAADR